MLAHAEVKWAVYKAIDDLLSHIADGRHPESVAAFTEDPDAAIYGSETGEAYVGPKSIRAFFADLYARPYRVIFTLPERTVSASGSVAWFTGEGTYRLMDAPETIGLELPAPCGLTSVTFKGFHGEALWPGCRLLADVDDSLTGAAIGACWYPAEQCAPDLSSCIDPWPQP